MTRWLLRLAIPILAGLTLLPGVVAAQVEVPPIPDPVAVAPKAETTAVLVLDLLESNCGRRPVCIAGLPAVADMVGRARAANVLVVYSLTAGTPVVMGDVAMKGDEPTVTSGADKFFNTNLDQILKDRGTETVVIVGTSAVGAVLYTSFGATARGYTVAVAQDGISSDNDFQTYYARYQLTTQPGGANPTNTPLLPRAVTLTQTDMVDFS